jgi:hypothetical protein
MHTEEHPSKHCLNCGKPLHGKYCAHCGQEDIDYKVALRHLIPEVLHEYLGFDSQIFKSIPLLLFKPGYLTNEFNEGRREKYIPPLRMYLIVSLLYFFASSFTGKGQNVPVTAVNSSSKTTVDSTAKVLLSSQDSSATVKLDTANRSKTLALRFGKTSVDTSDTASAVEKFFAKRAIALQDTSYANRMAETIKNDYSEVMFLILPACALLLKLLYVRRKRLYVEHLVFSFHLHAFAFIALLLAHIVGYFFSANNEVYFISVSTAWLLILVYLFMALRRVYRQSVLKTIVKNILFLGGYGVIFGITSALYVVIIFAFF